MIRDHIGNQSTQRISIEDMRTRENLEWIGVVFFCSGVPALIYQLVWQRFLFTIYGVNVESVTVVVTAFMLGLGIGSLMGGRLSRTGLPLLGLFAGMELGIALFGFFSLRLFRFVGESTIHLSTLATALITFGLILIPTLLMGASLPLLTAYFVRYSGNVGRTVGLLYFVNTLGSAFACFLIPLFLMRELGQQGTVSVAAAMNLAVAAGGLIAQRRVTKMPLTTGIATTSVLRNGEFGVPILLSALSGYIALSYEILWYRLYSFVTGGTAAAFPLLLCSYLVGIALGSAWSRRLCKTGNRPLLSISTFVLAASGFSFLVIPATARAVVTVPWLSTLPLVTLAASLLGAMFPLICHLAIPADMRAGQGLSYIYIANIVGSCAGTLITGFVLMDHLSIGGLSTLIAVIGMSLSAALAARSRPSKKRQVVRYVGILAATLAIVIARRPLFEAVYERLYYKQNYQNQRFAYVVENKSGVVTVTKDGDVQGSGAYDGVFSTDLIDDRNMIIRPYALSFLHPAPREVLMIGLSSGSWAKVIASHPQVERLTIIEINPAYLRIIPHFPQTADILSNPKVEIIIDDGRRWLARNKTRKFDMIVQNTRIHWREHASNVLSVEYQDLIRAHLKQGGISFYNTAFSDEAQRTGALSFRHSLRFINFMVCSDSPLQTDTDRWERVLREYHIGGRLVFDLSIERHRTRLADVLAIASTLGHRYGSAEQVGMNLETGDSIITRTAGIRVITDDNMGTEW